MTDYSKVCWSCGKVAMVNKGDYYQCSECGATWNEISALGRFVDIEIAKVETPFGTRYKPVKKRVRVAVPPTKRRKKSP